ncbi:SPFH domain-containing protein [bacterium]|nr:SPFH domain-containing protein [bacterium]
MALVDVLEWADPAAGAIVSRVPDNATDELRLGAQLIVHEGQAAVFFRDGRGLDVFSAGRHTLSTLNLPLLSRIVGTAFDSGRAPFRAQVFFVNLAAVGGLKWGTKEPVPVRDADLGHVRMRAFGSWAMRVADPLVFVNTLVGRRGNYSSADIETYLRDVIVSRLIDIIGENLRSIVDLAGMYDELAVAAKIRMKEDFARYGVELVDFYIQAVTPPEDVQRMIDERAQGAHAAPRTRDSEAAKTARASFGACVHCGAAVTAADKFCASCGAPARVAGHCECGQALAPDMTFCPACGARIGAEKPRICSACGAASAPGAHFCSKCGSRLGVD